MSLNESLPAEQGVPTKASVAPNLGFPNNRAAGSPEPTGWQASKVLSTGLADKSFATVEEIKK